VHSKARKLRRENKPHSPELLGDVDVDVVDIVDLILLMLLMLFY
jgi:hypothetical protein